MNLKTTSRADEDIIDIYIYGVREFGVQQAERYHAGLVEAFQLLADHPYAMRERREFRPPVRLYFHESHVIVYRIMADHVLIIRVLYGRQDWERHL
jgi:toxin ParE1/3/4